MTMQGYSPTGMGEQIGKSSILPSLATYCADHSGVSPTEDAWLRKSTLGMVVPMALGHG